MGVRACGSAALGWLGSWAGSIGPQVNARHRNRFFVCRLATLQVPAGIAEVLASFDKLPASERCRSTEPITRWLLNVQESYMCARKAMQNQDRHCASAVTIATFKRRAPQYCQCCSCVARTTLIPKLPLCPDYACPPKPEVVTLVPHWGGNVALPVFFSQNVAASGL